MSFWQFDPFGLVSEKAKEGKIIFFKNKVILIFYFVIYFKVKTHGSQGRTQVGAQTPGPKKKKNLIRYNLPINFKFGPLSSKALAPSPNSSDNSIQKKI